MLFTTEVNWSPFDFLCLGALLFGSGLTYILIARISDNLAFRIAAGIAVLAGLLLVWINLAVGIIGSEDHPANILYAGVLATAIIGASLARFQPKGMANTLFATAGV